MKHVEFEKYLKSLPPAGHVEALVSLDTKALMAESAGDYEAFRREKQKRFRQVAKCIRDAVENSSRVNVYQNLDKISIDANVRDWVGILYLLEKLSRDRSLSTEVFLNDTVHLIR